MNKIIFIGTSEFGLPALSAINKKFELIAIYTTPPGRAKRGKGFILSPVEQWADLHNVKATRVTKFNIEEIVKFKSLKPDIVVVCSFGYILPMALFNNCTALNIHPSLLPKFRGASPIHRAILNADNVSGVCTIALSKKLDEGDIYLTKRLNIKNKKYSIVHDELANIGATLIIKTIDNLSNIVPYSQNNINSSYANKITQRDKELDFYQPYHLIKAKELALADNYGIFFKIGTQKFKVISLSKISDNPDNIKPSILLNNLVISCPDALISIDVIQKPGKLPMDKKSFLNGHKLKPGTVVGSSY